MAQFNTGGGEQDIERLKRRLERAGANVTNSTHHPKLQVHTIQFTMADRGVRESFPSAIEVGENGTLQMVQIRLPTFTVEPDQPGLTKEEYETQKNSLVVDLWEEIRDDVGELIEGVTGFEYRFGVLQQDHVNMRAQHGYNRINITPHIEFLRNLEQEAEIDKGQLIEIVGGINDLWKNQYFNVKTVDRSDL